MATLTGLSIPVRVNPSTGGASIAVGKYSLRDLIILAFLEGDSDNPFQTLSFQDSIFANYNSTLNNFVFAQVNLIMEQFKLEGLAELAPNGLNIYTNNGSITPPTPIKEGEMLLEVRYINLQNQEEDIILLPSN